MPATEDLTIVIRARDAASAVLGTVGAAVTRFGALGIRGFGLLIDGVEKFTKRLFSMQTLMLVLTGGALVRLIQGLSTSENKFKAVFSAEQQSGINRVADSFNRLFATFKAIAGEVISRFADQITDALDRFAQWLAENGPQIIETVRKIGTVISGVATVFSRAMAGIRLTWAKLFESDKEFQRVMNDVYGVHEQIGEVTGRIVINVERAERAVYQVADVVRELHPLLQTSAQYLADGFTDAFISIIDGTRRVSDAFRQMASDILRQVGRIFLNQQFASLFAGLFTGLFSGGVVEVPTAYGPPASAGFPTFRAGGGPVSRGGSYVVGEHEPERFYPNTSGRIGKGGGEGITVNQTVNVNGGDPKQVKAAALAGLIEALETQPAFRRRVRGA